MSPEDSNERLAYDLALRKITDLTNNISESACWFTNRDFWGRELWLALHLQGVWMTVKELRKAGLSSWCMLCGHDTYGHADGLCGFDLCECFNPALRCYPVLEVDFRELWLCCWMIAAYEWVIFEMARNPQWFGH